MESAQMEQRNGERGRGSGRGFRGGRGRGGSREMRPGRGEFRGGRGFRGVRGERGFRGRGFGGNRGFRGGIWSGGERGFRGGRGFRGERGFRGGRGRGGPRGMGLPLRGWLVRGEYKEHPDYPGWSADEIFWLLEQKVIYTNKLDWAKISKLIPQRSPKDCADLWKKITGSLKPVTCRTAIDYMKKHIFYRIRRDEMSEVEDLPKRPDSLIKHFARMENLQEIPWSELSRKWDSLRNSKKAEYSESQNDLFKEYHQACFNYFKDHPEEFDKLTQINPKPAT